MTYSDTFDNLCVLLEEYADADIETIAQQILAMLGLTGEDLIEHLDPPTGLVTWLRSHGLSLVVTAEARSPRVWEALEADDEEDADDPEEEQEGGTPLPQVGDHVDYRTVPRGPSGAQQIGSGVVTTTGPDFVFVRVGPGTPDVYLVLGEDLIRIKPQ